MSGYAMRFLGGVNHRAGAVYVGRQKIAGLDVGNVRYVGTYKVEDGRIKGSAMPSSPTETKLVTGPRLPSGVQLNVTFAWPANFDNGTPQVITVNGEQAQVAFKVAEL